MSARIRAMVKADLKAVLEIDRTLGADAWTEKRFLRVMRSQWSVSGFVAEEGNRIVGFMVLDLATLNGDEVIEIRKFVVAPDRRRNGIGTTMVHKLASKLLNHGRGYAHAFVPETNLGAHLFLRENFFVAMGVARNHFQDRGEDAYEFELHAEIYTSPKTALLPFMKS